MTTTVSVWMTTWDSTPVLHGEGIPLYLSLLLPFSLCLYLSIYLSITLFISLSLPIYLSFSLLFCPCISFSVFIYLSSSEYFPYAEAVSDTLRKVRDAAERPGPPLFLHQVKYMYNYDCTISPRCPVYQDLPTNCRVKAPTPGGECCGDLQCDPFPTTPGATNPSPSSPSRDQSTGSTTPGMYDPNCLDKLSNCKAYETLSCRGVYEAWARENCNLTCGHCRMYLAPGLWRDRLIMLFENTSILCQDLLHTRLLTLTTDLGSV